jgi:hypothetical protein
MAALRAEFRWLSYRFLAACLFPVMFLWAWMETVPVERMTTFINRVLLGLAMVSGLALGLASVYGLKVLFA